MYVVVVVVVGISDNKPIHYFLYDTFAKKYLRWDFYFLFHSFVRCSYINQIEFRTISACSYIDRVYVSMDLYVLYMSDWMNELNWTAEPNLRFNRNERHTRRRNTHSHTHTHKPGPTTDIRILVNERPNNYLPKDIKMMSNFL